LGQDIPEEKKAEALTAVFEEGGKYGIKTYIVSDLPGTNIKGTALEKAVKESFLWLEKNESTTQVSPEAGSSDCDLVFTVSPLDIDHILSIVPLGNLNRIDTSPSSTRTFAPAMPSCPWGIPFRTWTAGLMSSCREIWAC